MTLQQSTSPLGAFAELDLIRCTGADFEEFLTQITQVTKRAIPGVDEVSITLVGPSGTHMTTGTDALALVLDEWQFELGHGPGLAAAAANITVAVADMAGESRWPDWSERTIEAGVHSSLSIGLPLRDNVAGVLNVYFATPHAFDEDAVVLAEIFAGYAAAAMANAHRNGDRTTLTQHLRASLDSRAVIERARGVIMGTRQCPADEAFAVLADISRRTQRSMGDVAADIVASTAQAAQRP